MVGTDTQSSRDDYQKFHSHALLSTFGQIEERETAARRATEKQILRDADHLVAVWNESGCLCCSRRGPIARDIGPALARRHFSRNELAIAVAADASFVSGQVYGSSGGNGQR